ncbi:MAG TPA: cation:proton antiporter [Dehalococcoidia bacterium]|nr:cation:proton antiporter [Dehalococcoidia bacterium]
MDGVLLLLGLAMASALLVQYVRVPYTVVLVVLGLALGVADVKPGFALDRDLILHVFLPLLLFEAALLVDLRLLRDALTPIAVLAVPGVIVSTLIIGLLLWRLTGLNLALAALFGAMVSATDPVAVLATFKRLKISEKLALVVEGESVLNDGTALVLFTLLLPAARGGVFRPLNVGLQFVGVLAGGLLVGAVMGWLGARCAALLEDHLAQLAVSALVAYGAFLLAERLQVSGVIATVTAGLVFAADGAERLQPAARELLHEVWEFAAFLANSLLFLLIGLKVGPTNLRGVTGDLAWAVAATLLARLLVVYGSGVLLRWCGRPFLWRHGALVFWSGLRGALAIALALSLPLDLPQHDLLLRLTAGVVLFTLLAQGLTIAPLLRRLEASSGAA